MRLAEARVRGDPQEDKGRRRGLRGRDRGEGGRRPALDLGLHDPKRDPGRYQEEQGQTCLGGDTGRGLRRGHRLRWVELLSQLHEAHPAGLGAPPQGGGLARREGRGGDAPPEGPTQAVRGPEGLPPGGSAARGACKA